MIPFILVTGFLGSGKTTLLKNVAEKYSDKKIVFLVNEFSSQDVDGSIVSRLSPDTVVVKGGSIFCRCLVTEFIDRLSEIPGKFGADGDIDALVVEASGMADPDVAGKMLSETGLDKQYAFQKTVCITDPVSLPKLIHTLPNIQKQLQNADMIFLNKTDCCEQEAVDDSVAIIRENNSECRLEKTVYCDFTGDFFAGVSKREPDNSAEFAKCRDPNFEKFDISPTGPICLDELKNFVADNKEVIYRVKGFCLTKQYGPVYVDYSKTGWQVQRSRVNTVPAIVFIVAAGSSERLQSEKPDSA